MNATTRSSTPWGGFALAAAGAFALAGARQASAVSPALKFETDIPGTGDIKVLNLALALEDLESNLYVQALQRLTTGGTNALGQTITGLGLTSSDIDVQYLQEFGQVETDHATLLRTTLGSSAISPFKYDFGITTKSRQQVVNLVYGAEALGVQAYLGAIPFLSSAAYLQIAGAIQGTEARHTAVLAQVLNDLFSMGVLVAPPYTQAEGRDLPLAPDTVLKKVSPLIVVS